MYSGTTLFGYIATDPEVRRFPSGGCVVTFRVATTIRVFDQETDGYKKLTEFHNVAIYGGLAKYAEMASRKGSVIFALGRPTTRQYEKNGTRHYFSEIRLDNVFGQLQILNREEMPFRDDHDDLPLIEETA